jgi:acetolactate synthase-1/2/3 large subunit
MSYIHGGLIVARAIKAEGITHVFTLCGGHVQAIYDGCLDEGIRVIDTRHEQSSGHAADGWSRVTGKPGVAIVTAGPGLTDAVTAAANAQRAQVPMVLIGGQAARFFGPFGGQDRGGLQDMNHVELMRSVCKWSVSVPETRRLADYMQSAFRIACSGVPGPVFLEMPIDVLMNVADEEEVVAYPNYRTTTTAAADPRVVERAAAMIASSQRPMLIVGSQWRWSTDPDGLLRFLDAAPMPAFVNGMARGSLPLSHPCGFKRARAKALAKTDCVIIFGTPLDFRLGYGEKIPANAKLIQIDLDGGEIGRNRSVDLGLVGDTGLVLGQLGDALSGLTPRWADWLAHIAAADAQMIAQMRAEAASDDNPINPLRLCAEVNRFVDDKTIVVGDGGDFVATAAYSLDVRGPGSWMDPGPLGTLGVGPGYAMAAKLAKPDHRVILMLGDGSFGLNGMEFEAMARQKINVVGVVGNDACWTQIHRGQVAMYGRDIATKLDYTRYDKVVEALGGHGEYVEEVSQIRPALERAFSADKPALVNVKIGGSDFRKDAISV